MLQFTHGGVFVFCVAFWAAPILRAFLSEALREAPITGSCALLWGFIDSSLVRHTTVIDRYPDWRRVVVGFTVLRQMDTSSALFPLLYGLVK